MPRKIITPSSLKEIWLPWIILLIIFPKTVLGYDPDCAHQMLSERAAELYALHYGKELSPEELQQLKQGSRHEDIADIVNVYLRSSNHFYDIYNHRAWSDPIVLFATISFSNCFIDAYYKNNIHTAKEWALNAKYQQLGWRAFDLTYCSYDGDYSWPTILAMLGKDGQAEKIAYALGHILHLVQDLTVPAHTRNDSHFPGNNDYLEDWAKKQCYAGLIPSARQLYAEGVRPIVPSDVGQIFDELATYTYSHYLSKDTKFSPEYDRPKATRRGTEIINGIEHTFLYTTDITTSIYGFKSEYRLIEVNPWWEKYFPTATDRVYFFSNYCTQDHWQRLMRKAVAYSAGMIRKTVLEAIARENCTGMALLDPECTMSCNPGDKRCSAGILYTCNAAGTAETSLPCPNGICQNSTSCSSGGMSGKCGTGCSPPLVCSTNGCVSECGTTNRYCCDPGQTCNIPGEKSFCDPKSALTCWPCGVTFQACCPGPSPCYKITSGIGVYCDTTAHMCWPCGGKGQRCCLTGTPCEPGTTCQLTGPDKDRCY